MRSLEMSLKTSGVFINPGFGAEEEVFKQVY